MGKDRNIKGQRNGKVIHLKKLFNGMSAEEVHQSTVLSGKKCACGLGATFRAVSYAPADELMKRAPAMLVQLARENGGQVPMVKFRHRRGDTQGEQFVRVGEIFGCSICRSTVEKAAAKGPSWTHVYFDDGPAATKAHSAVPGDAP